MAHGVVTEANELITPVQLATELKVSPYTLANRRSQKKLPRYVKLGEGRFAPVRYRRCDVDAWLNDQGSSAA